jgi:murein DD-endopeptidase MepM/ murein hydrolase activator NlpD
MMLRAWYWRVRNKLLKRYRVELIDAETLSQSREYSVKPITVVGFTVLLLITVIGGTAALVIYTPAFHSFIPNYIDPAEYRQERQEMAERIIRTEQEIDRWMAYYASFKQLAGVGSDSTMQGLSEAQLDSIRQRFEDTQPGGLPAAIEEPAYSQSSAPAEVVATRAVASLRATPAVKVSYRSVLDRLFPPLEGTLNNGFDPGQRHYGVDIVADENAMIRAATDGTVIISEYSEDNGWVIGISGPDNVITFYKHNSRLLKSVGAYVRSGEPVAVIGNTGENSSGMHLHFELWQHGKPLDPENHVNFE